MPSRSKTKSAPSKVGYRNPPVQAQFKKGHRTPSPPLSRLPLQEGAGPRPPPGTSRGRPVITGGAAKLVPLSPLGSRANAPGRCADLVFQRPGREHAVMDYSRTPAATNSCAPFHFKIENLMLAGQRANVGYHKIGCKIVASRAVPLFPRV